MIEWKDETVIDLSGGVTDLVTASGSEFQELCENLGHNPKLQLLSSRDGYRRFANIQTPSRIRQLFKLEDWILALCENGSIYYRLESDTLNPWTLVETPKSRSATLFRIYDSSGKGFTLRIAAPAIIQDQLVVKGENLGSGSTTAPSVTIADRAVYITVNTHWINSTTKKWNSGSGTYKYSQLQTALTATGWTCTLLSGTSGTDEVLFDELLTPQESASPYLGIYPAAARSDGDSTALGFAGEDGHLQASDWQSHLYLALEPYIKTFTANPSDPFGEDPETFPPTNQRQALRKIIPMSPAIGSGSTAAALKAVNAQLPKTYIGLDMDQSGENEYLDKHAHYRYQVYTLKWNYSPAYNADDYASVEIWCERTWGYQGPAGTMGAHTPRLEYLAINSTLTAGNPTANPIDADNPFSLCDLNIKTVSPYSYGTTGGWSYLTLCYHVTDGAIQTFSDVIAGIEEAFAEYNRRYYKPGVTAYTAAYGNFGYYIKVNPRSRLNAFVNAETPGHSITVRYADNLPEDVAGNHRYGFSFHLRESYKAMVEGSPREFQFDGPAAFINVRTLSPITAELRRGYDKVPPSVGYQTFTYPVGPRIFGGISSAINRDGSLYFQSEMDAVFSRTLDGGDVYYIEGEKKFWYRTGETPLASDSDNLVPDSLLTTDKWTQKTSYIVIQEPTATDDALQYEPLAYFSGDVVSFDSLPQGPYYFTTVNQTGYYANVVGNIHRVYQSPPGYPHASPATIFEDFDDEITGLSSFADKPIVTTQNRIWRIEGQKGADGSGRTFLRTVSDEFGCISNQSIVQTNIGLFLWSNSGIIFTDGLRALRVTEHLIDRYQTWLSDVRGGEPTVGPEKLRGSFDPLSRKVYWSSVDADGKPFFVVLSLQKGVSSSMPIVTESGIRFNSVDDVTGDVTPVDYFETQATLYSKDRQTFYRGQQTYLMVRDSSRTYDEGHVTGLRHPILPYLKSAAFAYGIPWARKQTTKILFNLRDLTKTGVSLTPLGWNDLSVVPHELGNCLSYQHMNFALDYKTPTPLDLEHFFKNSDAKWKADTVVSYRRHFGRGRQRNLFKQVGFQALKLRYGSITKDTAGVTLIELLHKAKDGTDFAQETVFIEITESGTALDDLMLDASGQFYVSWNDTMDPAPISDVDLLSSPKRIIVLPGGPALTNAADYREKWPGLSFYRVFTDQKIDMLGYNLTFRLIGDRTVGGLKSTDNGGIDA